jgi:hypothetical protein
MISWCRAQSWNIGAVTISILRKQSDKTYVAVAFTNNGRAVTLNFIVVNGSDGRVILDVESPHDSLRMFLAQYRNQAVVILRRPQRGRLEGWKHPGAAHPSRLASRAPQDDDIAPPH